jgi:hypothetical protein
LVYGETKSIATVDETKLLLEKTFLRAKDVVGEWGGRLYIVYLPDRDRYADEKASTRNEAIRSAILTLGESAGIPVVDIHKKFQAENDPLSLFPFRRTFHYNEEGNRLVAEEVLRSLSSEQFTGTHSP